LSEWSGYCKSNCPRIEPEAVVTGASFAHSFEKFLSAVDFFSQIICEMEILDRFIRRFGFFALLWGFPLLRRRLLVAAYRGQTPGGGGSRAGPQGEHAGAAARNKKGHGTPLHRRTMTSILKRVDPKIDPFSRLVLLVLSVGVKNRLEAIFPQNSPASTVAIIRG
jgi:hypothetical protein